MRAGVGTGGRLITRDPLYWRRQEWRWIEQEFGPFERRFVAGGLWSVDSGGGESECLPGEVCGEIGAALESDDGTAVAAGCIFDVVYESGSEGCPEERWIDSDLDKA